MLNAAVKLPASIWQLARLIFWLSLFGMVLSVTSCKTVSPVIKIGLVAPFEGRSRSVGYDVIYSARLAVRQVNEAGGIGSYRIALVSLDDSGEPDLAVQTAAAFVADPLVVTVVGHWLPKTTTAAKDIYKGAGLPFIPAGNDPFGIAEVSQLPETFLEAYEDVTPFEEKPGPFAGSAYDAINMVLAAMTIAEEEYSVINRETMSFALESITYEGLTGVIKYP